MYFLEATAAGGAQGGSYTMILMMVGMFALMYFMTIRPQKKRQKEEQEMRNAVDIGDEITTIGGICGKVVSVKENNLVIETGTDRTRMLITRWAVQQNNSAMERLAAEREAAKAAQEKAKAEKKAAKSTKNED